MTIDSCVIGYAGHKMLMCCMCRAAVSVQQLVNLHQLRASIASLLVLLTRQDITCRQKASIFQQTAKNNILVRHVSTLMISITANLNFVLTAPFSVVTTGFFSIRTTNR